MAMSSEARDAAKLQKEEESKRKVFFHMTYHPQGPPARLVQQAFEETMLQPPNSPPFNKIGPEGLDIPLDAMMVANHRSPNLENLLSYRKLSSRYGPPLSSLLEE